MTQVKAYGSMRGFLRIAELQVRSFVASFGLRTGVGRGRFVAYAALMVLSVAMILVCFWQIGVGMVAVGMEQAIPGLAVATGSLCSIALVFAKASGTVFGCKDYDLVAALPVSARAVVVARTAPLFVSAVATSLLITIVLYVPYIMKAPDELSVIPVAGVCAVLGPLAPVAVATLVSLGLTAMASHFRHAGIAQLIVSIVFVAILTLGAGALGSFFNGMSDAEALAAFSMAAGYVSTLIGQLYPPAAWAADAVLGANMMAFLLFIALSLAIPALVVAFLARWYPAVNAITTQGAGRNAQGIRKEQVKQRPLIALTKKELRRIATMPAYAMNDCAGLVLMVVLGIAVAVVGVDGVLSSSAINGLQMPASKYDVLSGAVNAILPWVVGFCGGISLTAGPSVSLESRSSWFLVTSPVAWRTILGAKLLANEVVALPAVIISFVLLLVGGVDIITALACVVCALGMLTGFASLALMLDAQNPHYAYTTPHEVVKRGLPVMVGSLGAVFGTFILGFVSLKAYSAFGALGSLTVTFVAPVLIAAAGLMLLHHSVTKKDRQGL